MIGLALEGGGAKGAFHLGAIKALYEEGWVFDGVVGTSIGAFNAAMIAQGDFEKAYRFWEGTSMSDIFDLEESQIKKILNKPLDRENRTVLVSMIRDIIENRGVDTAKIKAMLEENVDEAKLRRTSVDYGLVTVSLTDLKPMELYKEEIPAGLLDSYIMASANIPIFRLEPVEGKLYVDGGFYDNCPINMLIRKGYDRIVAVRTLGIGLNRRIEDPTVEVINVFPSEDLGRVLYFDQDQIQRNLKMGYFDTLRVLKGYKGEKYYVTDAPDGEQAFRLFSEMKEEDIRHVNEALNVKGKAGRRCLFERTLPKLAELLSVPAEADYDVLLIRLMEQLAEDTGVDRLMLYRLEELIDLVKQELQVKERARHEVKRTPKKIISEKMNAVMLKFSREQSLKVAVNRLFRALEI